MIMTLMINNNFHDNDDYKKKIYIYDINNGSTFILLEIQIVLGDLHANNCDVQL
jgi:hypothetical protein